jgi:malate dehydrogenase (oxaloacetate-decarboxylating)
MDENELNKLALARHLEARGKITLSSRVSIKNQEDLSIFYTPGVAAPSLECAKNKQNAYSYTNKWNSVAVISDGSAVLGLGDIGPYGAMPVMEGKALLFKEFAGIDAFPICLDTKDVDEIVRTIKIIAPVFGAINLEDISAPRCFEIESRLREELNIPIIHDDQHATAVVVGAALENSFRLKGTFWGEDKKIVVNGIGAAGSAIANFLISNGEKNIILCDKNGIVDADSFPDKHRQEIVGKTNPDKIGGKLADAIRGADVFIGVSAPNILTKQMVSGMNAKPIVFALANPTSEITPSEAKAGGAFIVATGRSDFPNQVNNALAFPGIFRGLLDSFKLKVYPDELMLASSYLAEMIPEDKLAPEKIIPSVLDKTVHKELGRLLGISWISRKEIACYPEK